MRENQPGLRKGRVIAAVVGGLLCLALLVALIPGCAAYNRWQKREDAHNKVQVVRIEIQKAEEEAKVNHAEVKATEAAAEKRVAEAVGIKEAQVEINKTLTPLYVQHEFVQAIEAGHVEVSMIPVGPNGLPLVGQTNVTPGK